MSIVLETERLVLRTWTLDDFDDLAAMLADPKVMEFLAIDGKPESRFAAWRALCGIVGHWQLLGFGMFAAIDRASGALVGRVGAWQPEGWPDFEVGWGFASPSASASGSKARFCRRICPIERCFSTASRAPSGRRASIAVAREKSFVFRRLAAHFRIGISGKYAIDIEIE